MLSAAVAFAGMTEDTMLEVYGDRAFRPSEGTLCLVTGQGDTLVFSDTGAEIVYAEDFAMYMLVDYLERADYWVVEAGGYEWVDWRLVNGETGESFTAISAPLPSPDGSRLLCFKEDISAGFIPNGIQVWRVDENGLVLEFEDVSVPWGPVNAVWEDDSTVVFEKMYYDPKNWDLLTRPGWLELSPRGEWLPDDPEDWSFGEP